MRLIGTYRTEESWNTVIIEPEPLMNGKKHWLLIEEHGPDEPEAMRRETVLKRFRSRQEAEYAATRRVIEAGGMIGESRASFMNNRVAISVVKGRWSNYQWQYVNTLEERTRIAFRRITGSELPEDAI